MLNSTDFFKDDLAQEKQADTYNMPEFSKILLKDSIKDNELEFKLNVG